MSTESDKLHRAMTDIERVVQHVPYGTADRPRRVRRIDLAREHYDAWQDTRTPASQVGPARGGSSSPREVEERDDQRTLARRVAHDAKRLKEIPTEVQKLLRELRGVVDRGCETIDESKLPDEKTVAQTVPGCVSCARPQRQGDTTSGFFNPVADPDPHGHRRWGVALASSVEQLALCTFCRTNAVANAQLDRAYKVEAKHFPQLKAIDLLHREGEQKAGRYIQSELDREKRARKPVAS